MVKSKSRFFHRCDANMEKAYKDEKEAELVQGLFNFCKKRFPNTNQVTKIVVQLCIRILKNKLSNFRKNIRRETLSKRWVKLFVQKTIKI